MADEKRLRELLYDERGSHFKALADEYDVLALHFQAKAAQARAQYKAYRDGRRVAFPEIE